MVISSCLVGLSQTELHLNWKATFLRSPFLFSINIAFDVFLMLMFTTCHINDLFTNSKVIKMKNWIKVETNLTSKFHTFGMSPLLYPCHPLCTPCLVTHIPIRHTYWHHGHGVYFDFYVLSKLSGKLANINKLTTPSTVPHVRCVWSAHVVSSRLSSDKTSSSHYTGWFKIILKLFHWPLTISSKQWDMQKSSSHIHNRCHMVKTPYKNKWKIKTWQSCKGK